MIIKIFITKFVDLIFRLTKRYKKKIIIEEIASYSSNKVVSGIYRSIILDTHSKYSGDFPAKLLGIYEEQVQETIYKIASANKLKYLINFGAAEGYHVIGLIKKKVFNKAIAFEIQEHTRNNLKQNIKNNKLNSKIKILEKADFRKVEKLIDSKDIKKTLYLVDIEGEEFNLFTRENLKYFKNSYLLIENHQNLLSISNEKIRLFFKLMNDNFKIKSIKQERKNPFKIKAIEKFDEDIKWLTMSECRPTNQGWLLCIPKNKT